MRQEGLIKNVLELLTPNRKKRKTTNNMDTESFQSNVNNKSIEWEPKELRYDVIIMFLGRSEAGIYVTKTSYHYVETKFKDNLVTLR